MGLRTKQAVEISGNYPLVLVAPDEVDETISRARSEGYRFLDMSAVGDATGKIRVALLFERSR